MLQPKPPSLAPFREVWAVDFEFIANSGDPPEVVCMVALEIFTGQLLRYWADELRNLSHPPFDISTNALYIAYSSSAECSCHLSLGWQLPENIFDCYVEYCRLTNGRRRFAGTGLLAALAAYGLDSIQGDEKEAMRNLILSGGPWDTRDKKNILDYCETDVRALEKLLPLMLPDVLHDDGDLHRVLLRGRYMKAVARMECTGIPIDALSCKRLQDNWQKIKAGLIADVDLDYEVYDENTFKAKLFADYLSKERIPWPRLESGNLALDGNTFRQMAKAYPQIAPLKELRHTLGELRLNKLAVGADGRNRTALMPFRSSTGRNQPSNTKFIFGPSTWLRGLIKPPQGRAIAYVDWSAQEIAIAAALSEDHQYMEDYSSGDIYIAFAKTAGLVPKDATKHSHKEIRDRCKQVVLGANYGMGSLTLASRLESSEAHARRLQAAHRESYPRLYDWLEAAIDHGMVFGYLDTVFGWRLHVENDANPRTLRNFPCQGNGAEMMRLACSLATEAGLAICCPVHDALLLEGDINTIREEVTQLQEIMESASRAVLDGFTVRTDAEIVCAPDRYMDPRGQAMWHRILNLMDEIGSNITNNPNPPYTLRHGTD